VRVVVCGRVGKELCTVSEKSLLNRHIPALDGLRALAVLAVIAIDVHMYYGQFVSGPISGPLSAMLTCGWAGVDLFFVLSGFLITGILYDTKGGDGYFRTFYARRTLRIMPLYFGYVFVIIVLGRLSCPFFSWIDGGDAASLGLYVYNFREVYTERFPAVYHHFWSLAVEEHFYLIWPLAVWSLRRRPLMRLCLAGAVASFWLRVIVVQSGMSPLIPYFVTPCRLDGLLAGSFVALAWRDQADWIRLRRWAGPVVAGSGGLLLGILLGRGRLDAHAEAGGGLVMTVGFTVLAVFFSGLIVLAVDAPEGNRWRQFLENKGLRAIGKYSYGIYVFSPLILNVVGRLLWPLSQAPAYIAKPVGIIWVLAASFGAAWLSYHLYEKHFLRLKRFFEYRKPAVLPVLPPSVLVSYQKS